MTSLRIIGLDPGLRHTGWGLITVDANRLRHVDHGTVDVDDQLSFPDRLKALHQGLQDVLAQTTPDEAAVEETFVNKNPTSTLKLGHARGVVMLVPALAGLPVAEYGANHIKKSIVGSGHAAKEQVQAMVRMLLPGIILKGPDAADALAVAICHAHHRQTATALAGGGARAHR